MTEARRRSVTKETHVDNQFRVLAIDGGGAKGMFAIGVLVEAEATLGAQCSELFDLVYGTSVGSIIAALIATGHSAECIRDLFLQEIPGIMRRRIARQRSRALHETVRRMFGEQGFEGLDTELGIVATRTDFSRPMIFKSSAAQAIKGAQSFVPGFGASLADAVMASCAARPFFDRVSVPTNHDTVHAIDGGFVANNPSLFALIDAVHTLNHSPQQVVALSVGVGSYPPKTSFIRKVSGQYWPIQLLDTTLSANANAMQILTALLFRDVRMVRINKTYSDPRYATSLLESNPNALKRMVRLGRDEFREKEDKVIALMQPV